MESWGRYSYTCHKWLQSEAQVLLYIKDYASDHLHPRLAMKLGPPTFLSHSHEAKLIQQY